MHSSQVNWPEGPGKASKKKGSSKKTASSIKMNRPKSLPYIATGRTSAAAGSPAISTGKGKATRSKGEKSPHSSKASTREPSLHVESLSQASLNESASGPVEEASAQPLSALQEGGSAAAVAQAAAKDDDDAAMLAKERAAEKAAEKANEKANEKSEDKSDPSKKRGWLRTLFEKEVQGEEVVLKDGLGRDRQVVNLLGGGDDLTRGRGAAFGVSAASGNQKLLEQDHQRRTAAIMKARKKSEAEKGGLFQKGAIAEHAPVGKRKLGFSLGCM